MGTWGNSGELGGTQEVSTRRHGGHGEEEEEEKGQVMGYTSGDAGVLAAQVERLLGITFPVEPAVWQGGVLVGS